jgi:hypothetical protein
MSDLIVSGSLIINGLLIMLGGSGTYCQKPCLTEAEISLMLGAWGLAEKGREFFNTTSAQWEGWNGSARVILG